jgi:PucR family transcriptional regulator, purine catabolism regulatory protein
MAITVGDLIALPGLGLVAVAGESGMDRPIRWAHTSELPDPTRWLSGGELLLTTGIALKGTPAHQRAYIRRLVKADVAGLGFGVGFGFEEVPAPVVRVADREGFPVLEVPYPVPFIAITKAVAAKLTEDRLGELQLSVEVHEKLSHLAADGGGPADLLEEMAGLTSGWAYLFGPRGETVARATSPNARAPAAGDVWAALPPGVLHSRGPVTSSTLGAEGSSIAVAVTAGRRQEGVLVLGKSSRLDARDRIAVRHGATVLGLSLAARRAVVEAERRIAGDLLADAVEGELVGELLERRLELIGFERQTDLTVMVVQPSDEDGEGLYELAVELESAARARSGRARSAVVGDRIALVVDETRAGELAESLLEEVTAGRATAARLGIGESAPARELRRSYLTALLALRSAPSQVRIASPRDLGSYGLLLGSQPRPVLEGFVHSILGPLMDRDAQRSSHLVESVRAFVACGGRWEEGARELGVHRHTLRYRINQAQELIERDLNSPEDRMEVWLACRALALLEG